MTQPNFIYLPDDVLDQMIDHFHREAVKHLERENFSWAANCYEEISLLRKIQRKKSKYWWQFWI